MKLSKRKIFSNKTFFSISSSGATTFQGDWFTENLQHVVVCYTPRVKCDEKKGKKEKRRAVVERRGDGKRKRVEMRVYLRVAHFFSPFSDEFGIFMVCAFFFSFNIIIPPHGKPNTQQLIPNFSLIVVSVDVSLFSTISAVFISILLLFNQLLILLFFSFLFRSLFFSGRNHSPIFILSSFVCEQRPQKVALGLSLAGVWF